MYDFHLHMRHEKGQVNSLVPILVLLVCFRCYHCIVLACYAVLVSERFPFGTFSLRIICRTSDISVSFRDFFGAQSQQKKK